MMCERALSRETQGSILADKQFVQGYIADSYAQLMQFRLFVLYTAWEIDKYNDYKQGPQGHRHRQGGHADGAARHRVAGDAGPRRARRHQRDAVLPDDPRRRGHGARRRPDRGAQGHGGPPGAPRLQAQRRPLADGVDPEEAGSGARRSSPSTSSTRWGTCDRLRPRSPRGWTASVCPARASRSSTATCPAARRTRSTRSVAATSTARCGSRRPPRPRARRRHPPRVAHHRGARRHRRPAHRRRSRCATTPSVLGRAFYLMGFVDGWSPMGRQGLGWPAPFDTDLDARQGLAYQLVEGHRAAVEGRLAGEGPAGSRSVPTASTSARSTGGPPSSSASRAATCPASTRPRRGCARTGRSTSSPG